MFKGTVSDNSEEKGVGRVSEKGEVLVKELLWGTWGYNEGTGIVEGKEDNDARSGAGDKEAKQGEPEPAWAILLLLNHFFAFVNFKILFFKEANLDYRFERSLKIPVKITIPFSSFTVVS